jgi:hypothetical protein
MYVVSRLLAVRPLRRPIMANERRPNDDMEQDEPRRITDEEPVGRADDDDDEAEEFEDIEEADEEDVE